jgi:hypothetical protein
MSVTPPATLPVAVPTIPPEVLPTAPPVVVQPEVEEMPSRRITFIALVGGLALLALMVIAVMGLIGKRDDV